MHETEMLVGAHEASRPAAVEEAAAAKCLKISVVRDGRPIVQVSFPAYAIVNLPDLVPDEVKPHIAAHAVDLEQLGATFAARGCPQGELFTLSGRDHIIRAWME